MNSQRNVKDIVNAIQRAKKRGRKTTLLIGAGCSITAGIPPANKIVRQIQKDFPEAFERASVKDYQHCMACLPETDQKDLIRDWVGKAKMNWAHLAIAQMIADGYVSRVLTTNFDNLLIRACSIANVFPAIYDIAASKEYYAFDISEPAIIHLHGQSTGFQLFHSKSDTEWLVKYLKSLFTDNFQSNAPIVVVGYSGENDPVFKIIDDLGRFSGSLYWIGYEHDTPPSSIKSLFEYKDGKDRYAYYLNSKGADQFFIKLGQKLGCFPPKIIGDPCDHLIDIYESIVESPDEVSSCKELLPNVIDDMKEAKALIHERANARYYAKFMAGKYQDVIDDPMSNDDWKAWAYSEQGIALSDQAKQKGGAEAESLFAESYQKFKQALAIKDDFREAFHNWGLALFYQARQKGGAEADRLYAEAYQKYKQALAIKPDDPEVLSNWGLALSSQAQQKGGSEAESLFAESFQKYEQALALKADFHEVLSNWGLALYVQAEHKDGAEADSLFAEACQKYEQAVAIKPDDHGVLSNWGVALSSQAQQKGGVEADRLFADAYQKYEQAIAIKADLHDAFYNWGLALCNQARQKNGAEADSLFAKACQKFAQAVAIKPDKYEVFYIWGFTLLEMAKMKSDNVADALLNEACLKFEKALSLGQNQYEVLNIWGATLINQAKTKPDRESKKLLTEAESVFKRGWDIKPEEMAYSLACLYGVRQDERQCRYYLEYAKEHKTLPDREHVLADDDLAAFRDRDWFKALLE